MEKIAIRVNQTVPKTLSNATDNGKTVSPFVLGLSPENTIPQLK
ncbi:hypothetical protein UF75_3730 [Desulfosporosinus sp. I2]|nr:hypothetical protein UF75_3730 [Desulfosporosinus sp. I2]